MVDIDTMNLFNDAMKYVDKSRGKIEKSTKYNGDQSLTFTPAQVVNEMLDMLPSEVWNEHTTFLDISCKTGVFLVEIYKRLDKTLKTVAEFEDDKVRREHILNKQLYGLTLDNNLSLMVSRRNLTGSIFNGNIKYIGKSNKSYIDIIKDRNENILKDLVKEEFGQMQFNVVVGNPPYNDGGDLDFADQGLRVAKQFELLITPAKWQTADANQRVQSKRLNYGSFRKYLVPYMSKVVYYPDCKDVFDIAQIDGTTIYLLDKRHTDKDLCCIVNKCNIQKLFNSVQYRNICNEESLHNIGQDIYIYISSQPIYKHFRIESCNKDGKYEVWTNTQMASGSRGGLQSCVLTTKGNQQYIGVSRVRDKDKDERPYQQTAKIVFADNNRICADSFLSWIDTKFVRFFLAINIGKLQNIMCDRFFRFVPAPPSGKFDHIYTDEELYKAFNLPQKYIDVIEAVVAERK